jgi:hypothetical protein
MAVAVMADTTGKLKEKVSEEEPMCAFSFCSIFVSSIPDFQISSLGTTFQVIIDEIVHKSGTGSGRNSTIYRRSSILSERPGELDWPVAPT